MKLLALLSVYFLLAVSLAGKPVTSPGIASNKTTKPENISSSGAHTTPGSTRGKGMGQVVDSSMLKRTLYVIIGVTIIVVLYFLVRAVRLKKTTVHRKKYGLLSNYDDTVEMAHLESDEEDTTVYEAKPLRR
ncbi:protein FAM174C [Brachyhypopomus gauderio]|uniref:protein FAM174C n=1 Tax=Brachyhypopomus gauderio TaxID=698409 RepID=UPI004042D7CA